MATHKVYDFTILYNELDILEFRLVELNDLVDHFIIVEAEKTFSNLSKPLFFLANKDRYEKYLSKIIYLTFSDFPVSCRSAWDRERYQRNFALQFIRNKLNDEDIVMICDIDEIPKKSIIQNWIKDNKHQASRLNMDMYYYNLNWMKKYKWPGASVCRKKQLASVTIEDMRTLTGIDMLENAGWHLSYFMSTDDIISKIKAFSHQELNKEEYLNKDNILKAINSGKDLFNRDDFHSLIPRNFKEIPENYEALPEICHPKYKMVIGLLATAINKKYADQIEACLNTWVRDAKRKGIKVVFLAGYHKDPRYPLVNLPGVQEDYNSAFHKQFYGIKYISEKYDPEFIYMAGTDTYINIDKVIDIVENVDAGDIYIGGHGDIRKIDGQEIYFHSGGSGFIINRTVVKKLLDLTLEYITNDWQKIAQRNGAYLTPACDVTIAYYLHKLGVPNQKDERFYACNYKGYAGTFRCHRDMGEIVACHYMEPQHMNDYYNSQQTSKADSNIQKHTIDVSETPESKPQIQLDNKWTLITGFFDLTKREPQMKLRDVAFYLKHAEFTLSLDYNMIIFCEKDLYHKIWKIRKDKNLLHKTYFIPMLLEEFPLWRYKERIKENRVNNPIYTNHRNTPSYFVLTASKFEMVQIAIKLNPFVSTHFGWLDFGAGHSLASEDKVNRFPEIFSLYREKASFCYIHYTPKHITRDYKEYYKGDGRCGTACNFFTGTAQYLNNVCTDFYDKVCKTIEAGYGHAEEQIIPSIYLDHPDWFEFYYGDYALVLMNYAKVRTNPHITLRLVIRNARSDSMHNLSHHAGKILLKSLDENLIFLHDNDIISLLDETFISAWWSNHKEDCLDVLKRFEKYCTRKTFDVALRQTLGHILANTDHVNSLLPKAHTVLVTAPISQERIAELIKVSKVFILDDKVDCLSNAFIHCNPVIRPSQYKANIQYDETILPG